MRRAPSLSWSNLILSVAWRVSEAGGCLGGGSSFHLHRCVRRARGRAERASSSDGQLFPEYFGKGNKRRRKLAHMDAGFRSRRERRIAAQQRQSHVITPHFHFPAAALLYLTPKTTTVFCYCSQMISTGIRSWRASKRVSPSWFGRRRILCRPWCVAELPPPRRLFLLGALCLDAAGLIAAHGSWFLARKEVVALLFWRARENLSC